MQKSFFRERRLIQQTSFFQKQMLLTRFQGLNTTESFLFLEKDVVDLKALLIVNTHMKFIEETDGVVAECGLDNYSTFVTQMVSNSKFKSKIFQTT